jgi:rhodanese-related sulfurtransferase
MQMDQFGVFVINHWPLFLALLVIAGLLAATSVGFSVRGIRQLDPLKAIQLLNHEGAVVVDIRDDSEFQQGHILNAVQVTLQELQDRLKRLERYKAKPVIIVGDSSQNCARALGLLRESGFETVYSLRGGIQAWKGASLPLNKG